MPLDALTAARLARDGERPAGPAHVLGPALGVPAPRPAERLVPRGVLARRPPAPGRATASASPAPSGPRPRKLRTSIDGCGVATYAFPLREIARAYAFLADPAGRPASDPRSSLAPSLHAVRDAMLANPEMVGGTRDRLDTSLMKAAAGRS